MPAPPAALITALRDGTAHRHIFFSMTHSQGTVRAWDGVGDLVYDGDTYIGVGGFVEISGVSDSGDLQNHEINVTLNGVSLSDLLEVDTDIRGETATITCVWLTEAGAVTASRVVAIATGDVLKVKMDRAQKQLIAKLRGPLAEWRSPPRAYWTEKDQQRRYSGDTGFKFVKALENASVSGWGPTVPASGGVPHMSLNLYLEDSVTGDPIGDHTWGLTAAVHTAVRYLKTNGGGYHYAEETSGGLVNVSVFYPLLIGGVACYVDTAGDVRASNTLLRVLANASVSNRLRRQGTIAADGTAGATRIVQSGSSPIKEGGSLGTNDYSALVYCNKNGRRIAVSGSNIAISGTNYVEATTLAAVSFSGGFLQCGGSDCHVSDTGVILTPGNRRVVKSGGSASEFLRVWT